jgi:hypothetical protein
MYVWRADSATRLHILQGHDGRCPAPCAVRPGHAGRAHALSCTRPLALPKASAPAKGRVPLRVLVPVTRALRRRGAHGLRKPRPTATRKPRCTIWGRVLGTRLSVVTQVTQERVLASCAHASAVTLACEQVHAALFAPAGAAVASASRDGSCKIWCAASGALLRTIGAGRWVVCADFGRDVVLDGRARRRREAVVMCMHPRLGHDSLLAGLEPGVLRMVIEGT